MDDPVDGDPTHGPRRDDNGQLPGARANDAPSSEVKHWASENAFSARTITTPPGKMNRRPLVALQRSTGTSTTVVAGRKPAGSVNAWAFVPLVAIAPLKCTIPEMLVTAALLVACGAVVQPFSSGSGGR